MRKRNIVRSGFFASFNPRDLKRFGPRNIIDRAGPLEVIFIMALLLLFIGLIVSILKFLVWVAALIFAIYVIYLIIWIINSMR